MEELLAGNHTTELGQALLILGDCLHTIGVQLGGTPGKKRTKRIKDPNRAQVNNNYMNFCKEQRPQIKEDHPEMKQTEVVILLGKMWKALSPEKKEAYRQGKEATPSANKRGSPEASKTSVPAKKKKISAPADSSTKPSTTAVAAEHNNENDVSKKKKKKKVKHRKEEHKSAESSS